MIAGKQTQLIERNRRWTHSLMSPSLDYQYDDPFAALTSLIEDLAVLRNMRFYPILSVHDVRDSRDGFRRVYDMTLGTEDRWSRFRFGERNDCVHCLLLSHPNAEAIDRDEVAHFAHEELGEIAKRDKEAVFRVRSDSRAGEILRPFFADDQGWRVTWRSDNDRTRPSYTTVYNGFKVEARPVYLDMVFRHYEIFVGGSFAWRTKDVHEITRLAILVAQAIQSGVPISMID